MRPSLTAQVASSLLSWLLLLSASAAAQDTLARAKTLYETAAYDEALSVLDRTAVSSAAEAAEVAGYRVFCLVALGRSDDAKSSIEGIVRRDPLYQPSEEQASPRILAVFSDVRQRLLPDIFQEKYNEAKLSFDLKDFPAASDKFTTVLAMLDDPALSRMQARADFRTVVNGFLQLSTLAVAGPAPAAPETVQNRPVAVPEVIARIYEAADVDVIAPVALSKFVPPWPSGVVRWNGNVGVLEVIIDENGDVASAVLRKGVHPAYDSLLVSAARRWKFRPATRQLVAVKYRHLINVR